MLHISMISQKFILLPIFIFFSLLHVDDNRESEYDLVIGILSARGNFRHRETIRSTWLKQSHVLENTRGPWKGRVKSWFILGNRDCEIPSEYRISPYSCDELKLNISEIKASETFDTAKPKKHQCDSGLQFIHQGFSFEVHHPIIIQKLGILSVLLPVGSSASVTLLDARSKDIIVSTIIEKHRNEGNAWLLNFVDTFVLPKGFEGIVLVSGTLYSSVCPSWGWHNGGGIISFKRIYLTDDDSGALNFNDTLLAAPLASFIVKDFNRLKEHVANADERKDLWLEDRMKVDVEIEKEIDTFGDILMVDVLDVYRNIPEKLMKFVEWVSKHYKFSYILKTDDDTFVNVNALIHIIHKMDIHPDRRIWMGRIRKEWPVNYYGKWADYDYTSSVYPLFMCGSGYIITRTVVNWLVRNINELHYFQGEDVSMGIWLAGISPEVREIESISCDDTCSVNTIIRSQLSMSAMRMVWDLYKMCSSTCSCG